MAESIRERVIRLVAEMRNRTVDRGCTPAEAAAFSAKVAEWIEKYQIEEAELRATAGGAKQEDEIEVCENYLRTGKRAFNPGMTQVVNALAQGMCCKCILDHQNGEAVYGITGDPLDSDYVCQVSLAVVPALQMMATFDGREHGYEKAGLVRWSNQYLTGASVEIFNRLEADRKARAELKRAEDWLKSGGSQALVVVTGETLAAEKRQAVAEVFRKKYPHVRQTTSRSEFCGEAFAAGREAGKRVGLNPTIGG